MSLVMKHIHAFVVIPMPQHLDNCIAFNSTIPVWGAAIRLLGQQNYEH